MFLFDKNLTDVFYSPLFCNTAANFIFIMEMPTLYSVYRYYVRF